VDPSVVTADYHPSADTARDQLTKLDQTVEQLKKMLRDKENEFKAKVNLLCMSLFFLLILAFNFYVVHFILTLK